MKTVAVIYGGKSGEHEVSLISASSVIRNIDRKKFNIEKRKMVFARFN